jgi:hypothetical protein
METKMTKTLISRIRKFTPCADGVKWLADKTDIGSAWNECPRGDWMLWVAAKLDVGRPLVVKAACTCARTTLRFVPARENRPQLAIEAAETWAERPTKENAEKVKAASTAAAAAASAYYYYTVYYAAAAAAASAYADTAAAAAYAADTASASAYADYYASASAASTDPADTDITLVAAQRQMADIVRQHIPTAVVEAKLDEMGIE